MTRSQHRQGHARLSPSTSLVAYLNNPENWKMDKIIITPRITCEKRLRKARNSVKRSEDNNDVLEFVGDRVNNLVCSLLVGKVKISSEHHKAVGRVLCNNDTLGRIAYQTILHAEAIFGVSDQKRVRDWHPDDRTAPPKALADIFEAYVGAVYEEHGWDVTFAWLEKLYEPLIPLATDDFLRRGAAPGPRPSLGLGHSSSSSYDSDSRPEDMTVAVYQSRVWDYLYFKRSFLTEHGLLALDALPPSTQFVFSFPGGGVGEAELVNDSDKAELATNLINFWICKLFMRVFPHLLQATYRGSHLVTWITHLVTSPSTLGYLAAMLSLSSFFDPTDVDHNATRLLMEARHLSSEASYHRQVNYCAKLALALKAVIGWYHLKDSAAAESWGITYLQPIVIRVHDIISDDPCYKPLVPESARDTLARHAAARAAADKRPKVTLDELARDLAGISLSQSGVQTAATALGDEMSRKYDDDEPYKGLTEILESQEDLAKDVVVVTRIKDDSLKGFHPLPLPKNGKKSDMDSNKPTLSARGKESDSSSRLGSLTTTASDQSQASVRQHKSTSSSSEQTLVTMFRNIKISNAPAGGDHDHNEIGVSSTPNSTCSPTNISKNGVGPKLKVVLKTSTLSDLSASAQSIRAREEKENVTREEDAVATTTTKMKVGKWKPIGLGSD